MATVTQATGLSPVLLRAWERRYALLFPERTPGGHRLYTDDDLRVLRRAQELLRSGWKISEVEALGREALLARASALAPPGSKRGSVPSEHEQLTEAAVRLDQELAQRALDQAFSRQSPEVALARVVEPALRTIGKLWGAGDCSVAGEHLLSGLVLGRLLALSAAARPLDERAPRAISACLPTEQHSLGSLTVAYLLARRGWRVDWLGAALPLEALERACGLASPRAVFLSVTDPHTLERHASLLVELSRRVRVRVVLGGAGGNATRIRARRVVQTTGSAHDLDLESLTRLPRE